MQKLIQEPLVHFLTIGAFLFILFSWLNPESESEGGKVIRLSDGDINRIISNYQQNWNQLPDTTVLLQLIKDELKTEVMYQEALAMNLDANDEIIFTNKNPAAQGFHLSLVDNE